MLPKLSIGERMDYEAAILTIKILSRLRTGDFIARCIVTSNLICIRQLKPLRSIHDIEYSFQTESLLR